MSLRIDLRVSRLLQWLQSAQIVLAALACLYLTREFQWALIVLLPVLLATAKIGASHLTPRALVLLGDEWHLVYDQKVCRAQLYEQVHCGNWMLILQLKRWDDTTGKAQREWLVILPDSASCESRRRLRSVLRWQTFPGALLSESK